MPPIPTVYPADLIAACPALTNPKEGSDVYDLGSYTVYVIGKYNDCSDRHAKLAQLVK